MQAVMHASPSPRTSPRASAGQPPSPSPSVSPSRSSRPLLKTAASAVTRPHLRHLLLFAAALLLLPALVLHRGPTHVLNGLLFPPGHPLSRASYVPPSPQEPPHCHLVGHDRALNHTWLHNSRSLCLVPAVCIRPGTAEALPHLYVGSSHTAPKCSLLNPDLSRAASAPQLDCLQVRDNHVFCAHGRFADQPRARNCPVVRPVAALSSADNASANWIPADRVLVVVPAFPWMTNIYHYSFVGLHAARIIADLDRLFAAWRPDAAPPRKVSLLFRGRPSSQLGRWNAAITSILLRRVVRAAGMKDVAVHALHEDPSATGTDEVNNSPVTCAHAAVLLGARGRINLWPFPNGSAISFAGEAVPAQAVALRRAVYDDFGVAARLPPLPEPALWPARHERLQHVGRVFAPKFVFDRPPLVVGYAKRSILADPDAGSTLAYGWRRFSESDEKWFGDMLREEARKVGAEVRELMVMPNTTVAQQVRWFSGVGFVVGIHGANLVNCMFAPVFGGLVEIAPGGHASRCYWAGGNAGLAYVMHEAANATPQESFCGEQQRCWGLSQHRRVKIDSVEHRVAVRQKVRDGLSRIVKLRRRFPRGIPARLELPEQRYVIDWLA